MDRQTLGDLSAFIAVARAGSFTRAAAPMGVTPAALSKTVLKLEQRLSLRLFTRTTRSVALTDAGERLLASVGPRLEEIDEEIAALAELRDKPAGRFRITAHDHPAYTMLWPRLARWLPDYPDIEVEIVIDYALTDIVADRFDLGVRSGAAVAQDMIAVRLGPDWHMRLVAAPAYLARRAAPRRPDDLVDHECINLRLATSGGLSMWELTDGRQHRSVRVRGQIVCNGTYHKLDAARLGLGITLVPEDIAAPLVQAGSLAWVLPRWYEPVAGYHLYYANRRHLPAALSLLIAALRAGT